MTSVDEAYKQYRRNYSKALRDMGRPTQNEFDYRYVPTENTEIFDGVDASFEELILYLQQKLSVERQKVGLYTKWALSGLATEMTMHEANSLLSYLKTYARNEVAAKPDDDHAHVLVEKVNRLADNFDFLNRFKVSRRSHRGTTGAEISDNIDYEFINAISRGKLVVETSDKFREMQIDINSHASQSVFQNLVRNSYQWGDRINQNPVIVKIDVETVMHEVEQWDEDTNTTVKKLAPHSIIVIEDNGPGFPDGIGATEAIFEPNTSYRGSSGIGLHLCKSTLEYFGMTIIADEEKSSLGGARIRIGNRNILRPDAPRYVQDDVPVDVSLVRAISSMRELVEDGHTVEASDLSDVYEEAAGRAMRYRLRGVETSMQQRLIDEVDGFEEAVKAALKFKDAPVLPSP